MASSEAANLIFTAIFAILGIMLFVAIAVGTFKSAVNQVTTIIVSGATRFGNFSSQFAAQAGIATDQAIAAATATANNVTNAVVGGVSKTVTAVTTLGDSILTSIETLSSQVFSGLQSVGELLLRFFLTLISPAFALLGFVTTGILQTMCVLNSFIMAFYNPLNALIQLIRTVANIVIGAINDTICIYNTSLSGGPLGIGINNLIDAVNKILEGFDEIPGVNITLQHLSEMTPILNCGGQTTVAGKSCGSYTCCCGQAPHVAANRPVPANAKLIFPLAIDTPSSTAVVIRVGHLAASRCALCQHRKSSLTNESAAKRCLDTRVFKGARGEWERLRHSLC